ncbi:MAG: hypothetical protein K0M50_02560 [Prolixibacteraceae bacterium]|nr:hypothetical protein [Prolixibacteraceae bacterium]
MRQLKIITVLFLALTISSCNDGENDATGVGDVLIVAKKSGNNTVYGLSLYAYTFSAFKSVSVVSTAESGKTYTLKSNQGYKTNFYLETPDAEFTTTKPAAATFNFSAIFENNATHEFQDVLTDKTLALPVIEKCEYNTTKNQLEINWAAVTDADSYAITIMDGSTVGFGSAELANTVKAYAISANGTGWVSGFTPESGKTYKVKVLAFLYEPGGSSYNVQASSVSETTVIWGE